MDNSQKPIIPVIICGGEGARLWPASRRALPKQFMPYGKSTLFKRTLQRAFTISPHATQLVICNHANRFMVATQIQEVIEELQPEHTPQIDIIIEPTGKNTAPAITVAALHHKTTDALLLVMPSDHYLQDTAAFSTAIQVGVQATLQKKIVTFGIIPTIPETGYGYIEKGTNFIQEAKNNQAPRLEGDTELAPKAGSGQETGQNIYHIKQFIEKPDAPKAAALIATDNFFWNSGIFLFQASTMLQELEKYAPDVIQSCTKAYEQSIPDLDFIRLNTDAFANTPAISIDYAVMEHTNQAVVVPLQTAWNDLGSWASFYTMSSHDSQGNATSGDVYHDSCTNCLFVSQSRLVTAVNLEDIVVVETSDAVFISPKEQSHCVKKIVDHLHSMERSEAKQHQKVYRPWGSYEISITGNRFQVKRLIVNPKARISLQRHYHRAEHWVVVQGTARIFCEGKDLLLSENQSTYIPIGGLHRIENPGKVPLEIIEIQTGSYLGENDIERLEDQYGR